MNTKDTKKSQIKDKNNKKSKSNHSNYVVNSKQLNLDKIKTIINNDKRAEEKDVKNIPIEKKVFSIIKKITTKIESEVVKEFINYKLILKKFKKSNNNELKSKMNAFYYLLLNKLDKKI